MDNGDELIPIPSAMTPDNIIKNGITLRYALSAMWIVKNSIMRILLRGRHNQAQIKKRDHQHKHQKQKGLTGIIENNHFYLLNDINTIRRFNGTIQDEPKGRRVKAKEEPEQIILNDGKTAYDFLMSADCLPCFLTLNDGVFNSFVVNKTKHILNPHPEAVEFYGDQYTGQTPQSVASQYLKTIEPVYMTHEIYDALTADNVKHRTHADTLHPQYFTDGLPNHEGGKKIRS